MPSLSRVLASAVAAEREAAGLTQPQLAEILGWTRDMVSKRERGVTPIGVDELADICRALHVDLAHLLRRADPDDLRALALRRGLH